MTVRQMGGRKSTRRAATPASVRPDDPARRRQHQDRSSVTLSSAFEIDQRHLGNICSEKELAPTSSAPAARRSARRRRRRRCSTSRSAARSTRSPARAACRASPSSSTARSTWCRAPTPRRSPKGRGRLQTTVPVVPDAPIGHFRLTVFGGKTGYLVNTRDICAQAPVVRSRLHRPERQDAVAARQGQGRVRRGPRGPPPFRASAVTPASLLPRLVHSPAWFNSAWVRGARS